MLEILGINEATGEAENVVNKGMYYILNANTKYELYNLAGEMGLNTK